MIVTPRYGCGALSDVVPSVLSVLGVGGEQDRLGLGPHFGLEGINRVCVLLIDGLGDEQLRVHPSAAPFLHSRRGPGWTAGFPSTTATSLGSLGTGLVPGEHGIVGYLTHLPEFDRPLNPLKWRLHGQGPKIDALVAAVPEHLQPRLTAFERAEQAGIAVSRVAPSYQDGSGLTRAVLRGGQFRTAVTGGDLIARTVTALRAGDRSLVYSYYADLDLTGHVRGPGSAAWRYELARVDAIAAAIASDLPSDGALIVTADHGMMEVTHRVDIDASPELRSGTRMICGEPRARHVIVDDGAEADVLAAWSSLPSDEFLAVARDDAIERGWFGPTVTREIAARIGHVVVVALGAGALVRRGHEPMQSTLIGHHGSLTAAEMMIPSIVVHG